MRMWALPERRFWPPVAHAPRTRGIRAAAAMNRLLMGRLLSGEGPVPVPGSERAREHGPCPATIPDFVLGAIQGVLWTGDNVGAFQDRD
ncbi:hypothetical protein JCM30394_12510 [Deferrisoma palaeochoriense]